MPVARLRCVCVCFALPNRLVHHVADKLGGAHGEALRAHAHASSTLRGNRINPAAAGGPVPAQTAQVPARARRAVFDAAHHTRLPGRPVRAEGAPAVADHTVNLAYDNVGITLDFYAQVLGRNSLDGRGMAVDSVVHYGRAFANAMWTGRQMLFGDGDGEHIVGFAQSLDIVAHELTHAVTQHSIPGGLGEVRVGKTVSLRGQAGALNESFSDVLASMVKQWHAGQTAHSANWLLGEGILGPHLGKAVRSLKDPGNPAHTYPDDDQAKDMRGYVPGGDAHTNSGIPNHAFYLAATAIGGPSWARVGKAWYAALPTLAPDASFASAATATHTAAQNLFGRGSAEAKAIQAAWRQVKVLH